MLLNQAGLRLLRTPFFMLLLFSESERLCKQNVWEKTLGTGKGCVCVHVWVRIWERKEERQLSLMSWWHTVLNIRNALQPEGKWLSDIHIILPCGPKFDSRLWHFPDYDPFMPFILFTDLRREMHSTYRWLSSQNKEKKNFFFDEDVLWSSLC